MRIFYDHQAFSLQDYGGITRIFTELIKGINTRGHMAHLSLVFSNNTHLKEAALLPAGLLSGLPLKRRSIIYALNEMYSTFEIRKRNFDIYHPTYYGNSLIKYAPGKPVVATYHDMINEVLSQKYMELRADTKLMEQKKRLIHQATRIIAVSENTKKDLINFYGISADKIKVIHLGNSFSAPYALTDEKAPLPYILYVGNRGLYKNFIPFLESVSSLLIKNGISLICAGGKNFTLQEIEIIKKLNVENVVKQLNVTDKELANLYAGALAFVFPSLYEGFGIPILEAFSCNCPCILSNRGSLPEVAGDAAIFIEPDHPDSIHDSVEQLINDSVLRKTLVAKGKERLLHFSWSKHIDETLTLYKEIAQ